MGAEIEAARAVIYGRLLADPSFNNYVSGRIYADEAPQGDAVPYATYRLVEDGRSGRGVMAGATPVFTPLRFRVMVWNKTRSYAAISARADRVPALFDGYSTTSGSYKFYSVRVGPHEERVAGKGGGTWLGAGYDIHCFLWTGTYVPAAASYLAFGTAGSELDLTPYCSRVEVYQRAPKHAAGRIDADHEESAPGYFATWLVARGPWSAALDAGVHLFIGQTGKSLVWGPEGSAAGKTRYNSASSYVREYRHVSPEGEAAPVEFLLVIGVSGNLSVGSF